LSENLQEVRSILVLAPQPFFQNRGTPIAVRLLVEELALLGYKVHLLVFHEGEEIVIPGVQLHRAPAVWGVKNIPPSISWKKIVCDFFMFFKAVGLLRRNRYDIIHAVEESTFMALVLKILFGTPYVYDMDSSLATQLVDKLIFLKPIWPALKFFEKRAIKGSVGVVAVCRTLEDIALAYAPNKCVVRLEDISLLDESVIAEESLRERYNISGPIMLYVGNLEGYQGIDLLLQSFQIALGQGCLGNVVIIGGTEEIINSYRKYAEELQIAGNTYFCGPRPVELLGHYLDQADILLSPRIQGNNTPMKLYSYIDSGKAVLATNLPTHTQVLTKEFACLVQPVKKSMAEGMAMLLNSPELCRELGEKGRKVARENYSREVFKVKLNGFYKKIFTSAAP
jgi:glycosyltransferase involved in cell wall biosynthesis